MEHDPAVDERAPTSESACVRRLIGVYHANGSVLGELSSWVRSRLGAGHCPLCDITHGTFRERKSWKSCRDTLEVPFETVHLDERDEALRAATDGRTPCVVAVLDDRLEVLVEPHDVEDCAGVPAQLIAATRRAAATRGYELTEGAARRGIR